MAQTPYAMTIDGNRLFPVRAGQVINPATEDVLTDFPLATREQLDIAVAAAKKDFPALRDRPVTERQSTVERLGDLIQENYEGFINLAITETGNARNIADRESAGQ